MDPILLQKQVRDNAKDLQDYCKDLKDWGDEMKKKDESLKRSPNTHLESPLPRSKVSKVTESLKLSEIPKEKDIKSDIKNSKQIKGCDYAAWEKFDADAYCVKLDKRDKGEDSSPESELSDEIDENIINLANSEKEKGNAFVKKQQWDQAIDSYTRAIECYAYDPIYYANRALCYLKKEKYRNAESDSTTALQLDKTYVKAYQRRAAAREKLNQISEAHSDLMKVLELEPKNKESKAVLARIEKKLGNVEQIKAETVEQQRPVSKFTLSRQGHKDLTKNPEIKNKSLTKEITALGDHVIERREPSNLISGDNMQPSTSGINLKKKQLQSEVTDKQIKNSDNVSSSKKMPQNSLLNRHNINDIEVFQSTHKPPKTRSKKPLKRIQVLDVNLETEKVFLSNETKNIKEKDTTENKDTQIANEKNKKEEVSTKVTESDIHIINDIRTEKLLDLKDTNTSKRLNFPIPKTAVQFYSTWKNSHGSKEFQKAYLKKINPNDLPIIFKESLESKIFSEVLETLSDGTNDHEILLYDYLIGLSKVKRFGALLMFMSTKDKKCLLHIIEYLKRDNKYSTTDVDNLITLYEVDI